jgi:outer membrane protein, heavy metal efflux system
VNACDASARPARGYALAGALLGILAAALPAEAPCAAGEGPAVTLQEAVDAALANGPVLAAFPFEFRAAEGRIRQASLRPNPEAVFETENVGGSLPGFDRSETTAGVSQRIETGGKRRARIKAASADLEVLRRDYRGARLDAIARVRSAFVFLLGAQERLSLAREGRGIASRLADATSERAAAGAVSPIEETRARVALSLAETEVARAAREASAARRDLAAAMGLPEPAFTSAAGTLDEEVAVPDLGDLMARLPENPDLARWEAERDRRAAAAAAARTLAFPDVSAFGGWRRLEEENANTFAFGVSVPIPLFDRNQGAVREAESLAAKVEEERRAVFLSLRARLAQRHAAMAAAAREVRTLRDEALAGARSAYDAVREGYDLGKFRYLDVLDAGSALVEARRRHVDALVALHAARIDVERLIAAPFEAGPERPMEPAKE